LSSPEKLSENSADLNERMSTPIPKTVDDSEENEEKKTVNGIKFI